MNYRLVSERLYIAAFNVLITGLIVHPYMLRDRVINKGTPVDMRSFSGNQEVLLQVEQGLNRSYRQGETLEGSIVLKNKFQYSSAFIIGNK